MAAPASADAKSDKKTAADPSSSSAAAAAAATATPGFIDKLLGPDLLDSATSRFIMASLWSIVACQLLLKIINEAYEIRMHAIREYGMIIHEFDPWFNYRATEYLYEHGWHAFKTWFDYKVWYPLGRPVGTTIYPGMQVTSVIIKTILGDRMSLNDVCCLVPAWFGAAATVFTGLMAYEACVGTTLPKTGRGTSSDGVVTAVQQSTDDPSRPEAFGSILASIPVVNVLYRRLILPVVDLLLRAITWIFGSDLGLVDSPRRGTPTTLVSPAVESFLAAAAIMSIVPAHIMRSVGGGYDNESIAMTSMTMTFYLWMRSLRGGKENTSGALVWGTLAGLAYFYMVAVWGGYIFVINIVGVHAGSLVLLGRYSSKLHRAYTAFYFIGTALAVQIPVVGWTPIRSLEQLGPMAVFVGFQMIEYCEVMRRKNNLSRKEAWVLRGKVFGAALLVAAVIVAALVPTGYFGPISARVRGLFVKHTKTGNPLVDSVAEHQPASAEAYLQYLHDICYIAPVGFAIVALVYFHDSSSFLLVYGVAAYFFSHKMVRLILLTAPIASALAGVALGRIFGWCLRGVTDYRPSFSDLLKLSSRASDDVPVVDAEPVDSSGKPKKAKKPKADKDKVKDGEEPSSFEEGRTFVVQLSRLVIAYMLFSSALPFASDFYARCHEMAKHMSHPTILYKASSHSGEEVIVDDYREAYWWLRDNTPEDARIMAWWDYGYQITGIGNRTTIADGNTWNHEHIALLGRALTSPEKEGHRIARHLADYVLLWTGGGGDDLAKSPHLARIANSVYRDMCPNDPTCRSFGFASQGVPTPKMAGSLLYKLHSHDLVPGVQADKNRFKEVFKSKYGKVRIFKVLSVSKESKEWVADPKNRICDAPGSWFCRGQYPPALKKVLDQKQDFGQLEDFNKKQVDDEYQKKYFEHLNDPDKAHKEGQKGGASSFVRPPKEQVDELQKRENWQDTPYTSELWNLIDANNIPMLKEYIIANPLVAHMRSADGRGPMFWAHEYGRDKIVKILRKVGVSEKHKDSEGLTPLDDTEIF